MPGLSGVELQRMMIDRDNLVPVIFITAHANERIRRSVMEAGAIGYLTKPLDERSLIQHLRTALAAYDAADSQRHAVR
jgi:FixJ family two-component response regulator